MGAGAHPRAQDHRRDRAGAERDHVSAAHRRLHVGYGMCPGIMLREALRGLIGAGGDTNLLEVSDPWQDLEVGVALHAGADDREHSSVFSSQMRAESAAASAVRIAVTRVPSITASGEPVAGSKSAMTA